ncbi:DJ-1/PfpI family protein [Roseibacterium sp. SDUM158017]|uniref:DJ-1/PfpI family protein n=1 Tax=Roseicyclus salinarum TaxID=3036773 RepID=UPI002414D386|nr:DJ-1/PfpI family protein [Roseibacterium sp. SDUM158017]MDG4647907.1 DJ-1/PfpI family protein [Roseibacterium sp. SDUM158017]
MTRRLTRKLARRLITIAALILAATSTALLRSGTAAPDMTPIPATDPAVLRPLTGDRRLVVILADNAGTETTDLLVPHGILQRSGAVDVLIVSTEEGAVDLMPALTIMPDMTVAAFHDIHPEGADAVIVPAFHSRGTEATTDFIRNQAGKGAMIVSICEGSEPVAQAGLFDGRAATTHWFAQGRMTRRYPGATWVQNRRYIVDGPVMSSSGVSASVPATLRFLEILAGDEVARHTATDLGVGEWSSQHDSSRFSLDFGTARLAAGNLLGFWRHEVLVAPVVDGFDGIAFALQADAWSRTYRSRLVAGNAAGMATSAEGVAFLTKISPRNDAAIDPLTGGPLAALDASLEAISGRYGPRTADFVAAQLEYHWP